MRVRLIAGEFGGRTIDSADRRTTHAMSERARGALFNSLGAKVQNAYVLDAFAGSGALGLEALSRGGAGCVFVEKDRIAAKIITSNVEILGVEARAQIIQAGVVSWCETTRETEFDLIFADPPYHNPQLSTVARLFGLLKPGGLMVLSHPGKGEVPTPNGIVVVDNRSYGNLHLAFFRREDA